MEVCTQDPHRTSADGRKNFPSVPYGSTAPLDRVPSGASQSWEELYPWNFCAGLVQLVTSSRPTAPAYSPTRVPTPVLTQVLLWGYPRTEQLDIENLQQNQYLIMYQKICFTSKRHEHGKTCYSKNTKWKYI